MVFGFPFRQGARTVGYECRVALGMAMIGNGANDTPVQSQVERDKTVATTEGGPVRTTGWRDSNEAECTAGRCVPETEGRRGSNIG